MLSFCDDVDIKPCYVVLQPLELNDKENTTYKLSELADLEPTFPKEASNERTKKRILKEIIESEKNYVHQLEIIKCFFIKPIKERCLLSLEDFEALFGHFNTIYRINLKLLESLKLGSKNVAISFSKIAPFFKLYSFYASEFKTSLEILQNSPRDNPKFAKFVEMQETRPEVQSKLSALLIAPIQRVPRYKLLLESLFNLTSPLDDDYIILRDSLDKVKNAADHINKIIKERENMQRLVELQRCLQPGEPNVITPSRNLIKEGILMKENTADGFCKKIYLVLTNDILMFCKMKKDEIKVNSLKCLAIYPLHKCKIIEIGNDHAFKLICQDEESILYHSSQSTINEWFEEIKDAIQTFLDDRKTLKKESSTRRPVKRKDLNEYNEIGLSPGKKLKKRQNVYTSQIDSPNTCQLTKRRPLNSHLNGESSNIDTNVNRDNLFVHLRPPNSFNQDTELNTNGVNTAQSTRDVFVFGQPNPNRGFSFRMNQWFCGIGTSVRKFFGFK